MNRLITTVAIAAVAMSGNFCFAEYSTAGSGKRYTFTELSKIENSGVEASGAKAYIVNSDFTVSDTDTLSIENNDRIYLADGVTVTVGGCADFAPAVYASVLPATDDATPLGFKFKGAAVVRNMMFKVAALRYLGEKTLVVENCTFYKSNNKLSTSATVSFGSANRGNVVRGCRFIDNATSALGGAANYQCGVLVEDCYFENCVSENANRPYINLTVGGADSVIVKNNVIVGNKLSKVGGIAIANLLSLSGDNNVLVEGNDVRNCRYGFTSTGAMNVRIINNNFIDNKYETNAMNGGSGISLYASYSYPQTAYLEGNTIKGNLWGVTSIMGVTANLGKVVDEKAADYNPGNNYFADNANGGVTYALYNNSTNTLYAQGNYWGAADQSAAEIEKVIFHKNDDSSLGEVIYMPAGGTATSVENVALDTVANFTFDNDEIVVAESADIVVYNVAGAEVASTSGASTSLSVANLPAGAYVVKVVADNRVSSAKIFKK